MTNPLFMPCGANPLFLSHCVGEAGDGDEPVELPPVPVPVIEYRYQGEPHQYSVAAETPYVLLIPGGYAKAADLQGPPVEEGQSWVAPLPLTGDTMVIGVTANGRWSEPAMMPEAEIELETVEETTTFVAAYAGGATSGYSKDLGFGTLVSGGNLIDSVMFESSYDGIVLKTNQALAYFTISITDENAGKSREITVNPAQLVGTSGLDVYEYLTGITDFISEFTDGVTYTAYLTAALKPLS